MLLRCLVCPPYKGSGLLIFSAGLGADRCLGWGWVLLRFAVFACTARAGVSGSGALAICGGCLRAGVVFALLAGHALLGPWCCAPAFGSCGSCAQCFASASAVAAVQLAACWRLYGGACFGCAPAVGAVSGCVAAMLSGLGGWCRWRGLLPLHAWLPLGKIKRGSSLAAFASVMLSMGDEIR